jgi:A/G-specific adenine glycosylase
MGGMTAVGNTKVNIQRSRLRSGDPILGPLAKWFERQQRILPWREQPTTYRVWISEIMLQQTQVITVVPYFEKFLGRFPTVESLAEAPLEDVLLHWAGLGYYSRARNIHKAARLVVEKGRFPKTREEWIEIPGVGEYTAGAILSIALNQPEAILDGNVERVLSRYRMIARGDSDKIYKTALWDLSREVVTRAFENKIAPRVTNQALMELGATICTPRQPKCLLCPIRKGCRAHLAGEEESFPPKKKRKEWIEIREELHCLISDEGKILVKLREKGEWRAGLYDLMVSAPRELDLPDLGKAILVGTVESRHVVTRHKITRKTSVWRVKRSRMLRASEEGDALDGRWITPFQPEVAIGSALKKTLELINETFPEAWEKRSR